MEILYVDVVVVLNVNEKASNILDADLLSRIVFVSVVIKQPIFYLTNLINVLIIVKNFVDLAELVW